MLAVRADFTTLYRSQNDERALEFIGNLGKLADPTGLIGEERLREATLATI